MIVSRWKRLVEFTEKLPSYVSATVLFSTMGVTPKISPNSGLIHITSSNVHINKRQGYFTASQIRDARWLSAFSR